MVTKVVTATQAKARILSLLDEVEQGAEIEITRHGRPVARLARVAGSRSLRGSMSGMAATAETDDDLFSTGAEWDLT